MAWHADTAHGPPQHPDRHLAVPEQGGENSGPRRRRGGRHGGSSLRIPSFCRITTKWIRDFKRAASARHFDAGSASQAAGRVSLAVTVAHNKVGRAYARPLHRQAHAPLGGGLFSPWLLQCLHGWIAFPDQVPTWKSTSRTMRTCSSWTDAASHNRGLPAVLYFRGQWCHTQLAAPMWLMSQLVG